MGFAVIKVVSRQTVSLLLHVLRAQWGCHTLRVWWMFEHFLFEPRVALLGVLCSVAHSQFKIQWPTECLVFVDKCVAINIPELAGRMPE